METIDIKDIDFNELLKLSSQGSTSTIYRNDEFCFKILDGFYEEEKKVLYEKFLHMKDINIDGVLLPKCFIMDNGIMQGYIMSYFKNSVTLNGKYNDSFIDLNVLAEEVIKASKILRMLHENGIICQDISFENILVDDNEDVAFCDLDGCCYDNYISPFVSKIFSNFMLKYRQIEVSASDINENMDNLCFLLSLCYLLFHKELSNIASMDYKILENSNTPFRGIVNYIKILKNRDMDIPEIPYLDDLIYFEKEKNSNGRALTLK